MTQHLLNLNDQLNKLMFVNVRVKGNCVVQICSVHVACVNVSHSLPTLQVDLASSDMALALNRYLCASVLPLLTKCSALFCDLEDHVLLVDSLIQAIYSLSNALSLTKAQRDTIEDCLLTLCR